MNIKYIIFLSQLNESEKNRRLLWSTLENLDIKNKISRYYDI